MLLAMGFELRARGHDVEFEFAHDDGPAVALARTGATRVHVTYRPRLPRNAGELGRYVWSSPGAVRRMRRLIRDGRFDIVWVNSIYNPLAAVAASGARRPVVVWHLHERNFPGVVGGVAAAWIRRFSNMQVAVSRFVADSFESWRFLHRRVRVCHNALLRPIRPVAKDPGSGSGGATFTVGFVGQFEPVKRAPDVVHALARLPSVTGLFVGDGKGRDRVENAIKAHGLQSRVRLAGFQADVRPYLELMDCVVIPSRVEGFCLVALEAMAAGVPVVASRSGALPEVLGDAALYYPPGDVEGMAGAIDRLVRDPELAMKLGAVGSQRVVSDFGVDRWIDSIEAVALAAVNGGRR